MIQPFFDYACSAWYPSLRKDLQKRLQVSQNNCITSCLPLDKKTRIGVAKFKETHWLNVNDDFHNTFWPVFIIFLTVKAQNTLMKLIFLLNPVT